MLVLTSVKDLIFIDVELRIGDLLVTVFELQEKKRKTYWWRDFEMIPGATQAVVAAGWSCQGLQGLSQKIRKHQVSDVDLQELRKEAVIRRMYISTRDLAGPVSAFE